MRVVHLADLHAGKTLGNLPRHEDLRYALEQVVRLVKDARAELVLVAGDVFDKPNPDNESKEIVFDFFLQLKDLSVPAVVVAGNHDSPEFMRSVRKLLRTVGVFVFPKPDPQEPVLRLNELAVAVLPYPSERIITKAEEGARSSYAVAVQKYVRYLAKQTEDAPLRVLLAHLFVAGAKYTRTEREATITDFYAVPPDFPESFQFVALGHVHRHQRVNASPAPAYYAGSLFQLDFSESGQKKFVNLVELSPDAPARVEPVELSLKRPLYFFELEDKDALRRVSELKKLNGLIKLRVFTDDRERSLAVAEQLRRFLGEKLVKLELELRKKEEVKESPVERLGVRELYEEFHRRRYGKKPSEELVRAFDELVSQVGL
ncbi:MAG: exonuclease subunit SbcD [Aquificae bacterium]|nr:exonuclease subunit SbcD [Aquificota bacterium]